MDPRHGFARQNLRMTAILFPGATLSPAELSAATLDGHLCSIGDGYAPADSPETAWLRAQSLRPLLGEVLAATHRLAGWVWGALSEQPGVLTTQRVRLKRFKVHPHPRVVYRDGVIPVSDLEHFGAVAVTSIVRTVADLARTRDLETLHAMLREHPAALEGALEWCATHTGLPGARGGIEVLKRYAPTLDGL